MNATKSPFLGSIIGCPLACFRELYTFCVDQGEEIDPDERYQCVQCSDVCPGPNETPDTSQVSETCIRFCREYLQKPILDSRQVHLGILGPHRDGAIIGLYGVLIAVCIVVIMTLVFKKKCAPGRRQDVSDTSNVQPPQPNATTQTTNITSVHVTQANSVTNNPSLTRSRNPSESDTLLAHAEEEQTANDHTESMPPLSSSHSTTYGVPEAAEDKSSDAQITSE